MQYHGIAPHGQQNERNVVPIYAVVHGVELAEWNLMRRNNSCVGDFCSWQTPMHSDLFL